MSPAGTVPRDALRGVRVLVLDDDELIRTLGRRTLTAVGATVECVANAREALQTLLRQDFDVVVVDLRMQEMDGMTFIREARNIWPWLGFLILTGYADEQSKQQAATLGITRILEKPLSPSVLQRNVLDEVRHRREKLRGITQTLEQNQSQLRILAQLSQVALATETPVEALRRLSEGLGQLLFCEVVGLLGLTDEERIVILNVQKPVAQPFLDQAEREIVARYEALSGQKLAPGDLRIQIEGAACDPAGPSRPANILTVPILSHGEIQGLLLLATATERSALALDVSYLYHVANLLATVLATVHRMRQMAIRDPLTGVYNRAYLEEELERAWLLARRHGHHTGVVIMDVDHFKALNDTHGHLVGDQVLREFASVIRQVARSTDVVARYGGDEFVVVLPQTEPMAGLALGNRILNAVSRFVFCESTLRLHLTTSVGVVHSGEIPATKPASEMLRLADQALYAAKHDGRNCVRVWSDRLMATGAGPSVEAVSPQNQRGRILVLDDDPAVGKTVEALLSQAGYEVLPETSPAAALARIRERPGRFDVVITDLSMPEVSGFHVLDELRTVDDLAMRIVLTGFATKENAVASLRHGAFDFVEKPISADQLLAVVEKALDHRRLRIENERYRHHLEEMVRQKSAELLNALERGRQAHNFTLRALVALLDAREHATGEHSTRVMELTLILGRTLQLPPRELEILGQGALLHDIGKIALPDAILLKPGPLDQNEWRMMRTHPEVGYNILRSNPDLQEVAEIVYAHQERFDGSGYPRGLRGNEICLGARIFAVVDTYDALRTDRVYRRAVDAETALAEVRRGAGSHFDPTIVAAFVRCQPELEKLGAWPTPAA